MATPFLLLMPSWVAATDYWQAFLFALAVSRGSGGALNKDELAAKGALERRAGVFYVSPLVKYAFTHPESTGHASAPFHPIWFCGGWSEDEERKVAMAALKPLRRAAVVEVFRSRSMLQRRGHFTPGLMKKRTRMVPR